MTVPVIRQFQFTDACASALLAAGAKTFSFGSHPAQPDPLAGDLVSFAEFAPIVFRVIQREFHWKSPGELVIIFTLDVPGEFVPDRQRQQTE